MCKFRFFKYLKKEVIMKKQMVFRKSGENRIITSITYKNVESILKSLK